MLLIEWSPSGVCILDPAWQEAAVGRTLADARSKSSSMSHDAIVAVTSRSAFIRTVPVPSVSKEEMRQMVALKLIPLLPFHPGEYVSGFRVAAVGGQQGKQAIVGAAKTDLLREILSQAKGCGVRVKAIVPLAFGSWLAAKHHGLRDGAVVTLDADFLTVDIIEGGELHYSRSIPLPESEEGIQAEIERTFTVSQSVPGPVLSCGRAYPHATMHETRHPIEFLAEGGVIEKFLFSLELPEVGTARRKRTDNAAMRRALVASIAAVALGSYESNVRTVARAAASKQIALNGRKISSARHEQQRALQEETDAMAQNELVRIAFHPAQNFSDVVTALGASNPHKTWFNGLTLERGRPLIARGVASTGKELADYIEDITVGDRFRSLRVLSATNGAIGKKSVVQFSITGWIVGNLPLEMPKKAVKS